MVLVVLRNHAVVVGKLALDELGDELHAAEAELRLVAGEAHLDGAFVCVLLVLQEPLKLEHRLARQDDFLLRNLGVEGGLRERQAVTVGGHEREALAFGHEQDAVEVVADVVHRHREMHLVDEVLERLLRHAEHRPEVGRFLHEGEVVGGQRLQR